MGECGRCGREDGPETVIWNERRFVGLLDRSKPQEWGAVVESVILLPPQTGVIVVRAWCEDPCGHRPNFHIAEAGVNREKLAAWGRQRVEVIESYHGTSRYYSGSLPRATAIRWGIEYVIDPFIREARALLEGCGFYALHDREMLALTVEDDLPF
jgi:hypothetical protein